MLAQDKESLKAHLHTQALHIRERELNLFHDSLATVGTQAALFAGFAFGAFIEFEIPEGTSQSMIGAFSVLSILTLVLNINCVIHAISVCVWGPGLALRGKSSDSMIRAVEAMKEERYTAFRIGFLGTIGIQLAACIMSFIAFESSIVASLCTIILITSVMTTMHTCIRVRARFAGEHDPTALHSYFDGSALPSITTKPSFLREVELRGTSNALQFNEVEATSSSSPGPPICNHSGYLFRKKGPNRSSERLFFVLYEQQLWCYRHRKGWQIRETPHEIVPLNLDDFLLREVIAAKEKGPPREAILSYIRKSVTGDGDMRIRDYMADKNLRNSLRTSASEHGDQRQSIGAAAGETASTNGKNLDHLRFQLFPIKVLEQGATMVDLRAETPEDKRLWLDALNSGAVLSEGRVEAEFNNSK